MMSFKLNQLIQLIEENRNNTELELSSNQLTGSIPYSICNLTNLTKLELSNNKLTGSIPDSICNLTNLTYLELSINKLTGSIPDSICNLTNLTVLGLSNNQLTGSIPVSICNLTNLKDLGLLNNKLTGSIPDSICNLTNLTELGLQSNQLTGSIPDSICNLTNLTYLGLQSNKLTGSIPDSICNLTNLTYLGLFTNQLTGSISDSICNLTKLDNKSEHELRELKLLLNKQETRKKKEEKEQKQKQSRRKQKKKGSQKKSITPTSNHKQSNNSTSFIINNIELSTNDKISKAISILDKLIETYNYNLLRKYFAIKWKSKYCNFKQKEKDKLLREHLQSIKNPQHKQLSKPLYQNKISNFCFVIYLNGFNKTSNNKTSNNFLNKEILDSLIQKTDIKPIKDVMTLFNIIQEQSLERPAAIDFHKKTIIKVKEFMTLLKTYFKEGTEIGNKLDKMFPNKTCCQIRLLCGRGSHSDVNSTISDYLSDQCKTEFNGILYPMDI